MTESPAIHARGLTRRFGDRTAVDALDLEVPRGAIFGFLGPNGAGKTTTIRMLLGLSPADAGEAWILGHHFRRERAAICERVGAIVETPAFHGDLTGLDNLRVCAWTSGLRPRARELESLLDQVGLSGRGREVVGGYSLGMRQRLGLAAALVNEPELLFLDEPTNGLDPAGILEMRGLLRGLAERGKTIFVSSHILHEVEAVCSDVVILHRGTVRLQGTVAELLGKHDTWRVRVSSAEQALEVAHRAGLQASVSEDGQLEVCIPETAVPGLVRGLVGAGVDVFRVAEHGGSLETLFLQWTSEAEGS